MKLIKNTLLVLVFLFCLNLVSAESYIDYAADDDINDLGLISYTEAPKTWTIELDSYDEVGVGIYTSARDEPRMYAGYSGYLEVNGEKLWEHTGGSDKIRLSDGTEISDYDTTNDRYFDVTDYLHTGENTITYYHYTGDGQHGPKVLVRTAEGLSEGDDTLDLGLIPYTEAPKTWEIKLSSFDKVGVGVYTSARTEPRMYAGYSGYLQVNGEKLWEHTGSSDTVKVLGEEISDYNKDNNRYFDITDYVSAGKNTITYYHYTGDGLHGPKVTVHGGSVSLWEEGVVEEEEAEVEEEVVIAGECPSGCAYDSSCISPAIRKRGKFCDTDNIMKEQKTKQEQCDNSYECKSNLCAGEVCVSAGLIRRILNWLISVLG